MTLRIWDSIESSANRDTAARRAQESRRSIHLRSYRAAESRRGLHISAQSTGIAQFGDRHFSRQRSGPPVDSESGNPTAFHADLQVLARLPTRGDDDANLRR